MGGRLPGHTEGAALRIGVIGAGFIGAVHAHAARRARARVVGTVASSPAGTEQAVARLGAERGFGSAEELAISPDIDVVHICTPNHLHRPLAEAAMAAGKHVICEKPLATSAAEADGLRAAARTAGVVATVPFVYRFYPMVREARARVTGDFGPVRLVHGGYLQDWLSADTDDNWRVDADRSGPSRAFADIGSHWCDLVEFVTGDRLAAVFAELITAVPDRVTHGDDVYAFESPGTTTGRKRTVTTEDIAIVMFRTERGVPGSLVVSQISSGHKNQLRFEISGAVETIAFDQERPDTLWIGRRASAELLTRDAAHLHPAAASYATVPPGHPQGYQECFDAFVADTYLAVAAGSIDGIDGLPTFVDGARAARITDAVLRSDANRRWVDVTTDDAAEPKRSSP